MKKNRIRALTAIIVTALSVALAGCSEMDNMSRTVRADADIAQQHMDSQKRHQAPLVWTDKPWVSLKPIVQATPSPQKAGLPVCNITIGSRDGLTLPEISGLITRRCGVRVILSPEVMAAGSGTASAGVTRRTSGTLPVPDDSGRIPLDQLGGTGGGQQAAAASFTLNSLRWQGQLGGLLDNITARTGLSWRTNHGAVVFYLTETRTFQFAFLNTRVNSNASVSSGSTSSMGTSGGSGGGDNSVSGDSSSSQKTTTLQDRDAYEDIRKTMETILTPEKGRYWLSESTGVLTVTDTPQVLETVSHYVDEQNRKMNRQVRLSVQVLSVTASRKEQFGLDWNVIYRSLQAAGASLNGVAGDMTGVTSLGVSILDTATGRAGQFSGSSLLLKALSEQGDVSVVTTEDSLTTNLSPVSVQMADQTVYVAGSATTTTTDVGATTTLTPGMITTGFNLILLPMIKENGDVQLQMAFNLSDPPTIRSYTPKDGNSYIEMPYTRLRSLGQKPNLRAGQSLILTGFSQDNTSVKKSGTFTPGNFLFGGGRNGEHGRSTLVIIITPLLVGNNGD
ncbi:TPA: PilN family type IVB pilus formation outer membrane protein [Salmonella enterica]|uniref:PilN family type IVB pilus formation outer membrane protein n=1 Tax=Salmonella enterica I TaxID=59201 RepID=A0A612KU97_SALET|nr:PilN family type IVB pilus formation outer membrane protein [Salmonella enterica subsp. enterica]EHJ3658790.1 PilN family type IVB pilus formation outer membrane protein [Salmonella enterica]HDN4850015.1 PilN family type IVB pilus formation outer membrane protein [Salmonella enterica subsp. enterica serovar Bovismorbificans]HDO5800030.1 PilN family type IVB pilus formation outer membrane protein [Salmonella enterica subsp. enterica serovar Typhimurium]HEC7107641.1 PilN family type IVB pilus 